MRFFSPALCSFALVACLAGNAFSAVEYTLHKSANPTSDEQDAYKRITTVMDSAVKMYNTYSNLSKFINVYYCFQPTPLFVDTKGPKITPMSVGISLSIF